VRAGNWDAPGGCLAARVAPSCDYRQQQGDDQRRGPIRKPRRKREAGVAAAEKRETRGPMAH